MLFAEITAVSAYDAGRRGKAWRKIKPVHTLDLVVVAAEWGTVAAPVGCRICISLPATRRPVTS